MLRCSHTAGDLHELTFSCDRRLPLRTNDVCRAGLSQYLDAALVETRFELSQTAKRIEKAHRPRRIHRAPNTARTTLQLFNSSTLQLFNSSTPQLLNSSTPQLLNSSTPQLLNSLPQIVSQVLPYLTNMLIDVESTWQLRTMNDDPTIRQIQAHLTYGASFEICPRHSP